MVNSLPNKSHTSKKEVLLNLVLFAPDGRHMQVDADSYRKYIKEFGIKSSSVISFLNQFYSTPKIDNVSESNLDIGNLAKRMKLIDNDSSISGYLFFLPRGKLIFDLLLDYLDQCAIKYGYTKIDIPLVFRRDSNAVIELTEKFMHGGAGPDDERMLGLADGTYLRYASDPVLFPWIAAKSPFGKKDLPLRVYSPTLNFRHEKEGELKLLVRSISFTITDLHSFVDSKHDLEEYLYIHKINSDVMHKVCADDWFLMLDVTEEFFNENLKTIEEVVKYSGVGVVAKVMSSKTHYYSIQHQYRVSLSNGTTTQVANLQFDRVNGRRFDIKVREGEGTLDYVTIVHAAQYGRVEKVIAYLIDKAMAAIVNNKQPLLPFWLSPTQVRIIPIKDNKDVKRLTYSLINKLKGIKIRVDLDADFDRHISEKIKVATKEWVPYIVVIGEKEAAAEKISIRDSKTCEITSIDITEFIKKIEKEQDNMPHRDIPYSEDIYKRPLFF